jgi:hypothetical protein
VVGLVDSSASAGIDPRSPRVWHGFGGRVGVGDATTDFQASLLTTTNVNVISDQFKQQITGVVQNTTGNIQAKFQQYQQQINNFSSTQVGSSIEGGVLSAANGQALTEAQIQGGFTAAATAGAVVAGVTLAAAGVVMAPIALLVFGGGEAIGLLVKKLFDIKDIGPIACSEDDHTNYGTVPGDPNWITYQFYVNNNAPPGGWTTPGQHWQPYSNGAFETWARPIVMRAMELPGNCKVLPGALTFRQFAQGLGQSWNARFPNSPVRKIGYVLDDYANDPRLTYGSAFQQQVYAWANDPIQAMIQGMAEEQRDGRDRTIVSAPPLQHPWGISVADPSPGTAPASVDLTGTVLLSGTLPASAQTKVATAAVAAPAALAVGTIVYAYATGKTVDAVFRHLWSVTKGYWDRVTRGASRNPLSLIDRRHRRSRRR